MANSNCRQCNGEDEEICSGGNALEHGCEIGNSASERLQNRSKEPLGKSGENKELERPNWWSVEPNVGRVAHGVPARVDRLKGLGNAVVPQVAEWIGRRIMECDG